MAGRSNYTVWQSNGIRLTCENNTRSDHLSYISRNVYWFYVGGLGLSCGCSYARASDDGIRCGHTGCIFPRLYELMLVAMEAEVRSGGFEAFKWEGTLPRRSAKAVERLHKMVGEALEEKLLPPLCDIVVGYI